MIDNNWNSYYWVRNIGYCNGDEVISVDSETGNEVVPVKNTEKTSKPDPETSNEDEVISLDSETGSEELLLPVKKESKYPEDKTFFCNFCDKTFFQLKSLKLHTQLQHSRDENDKLECDICEKSFHEERALRIHKSIAHDDLDICEVFPDPVDPLGAETGNESGTGNETGNSESRQI